MRNPARIPKILALLERYWELHPDLRLGQLLYSLLPANLDDPFYLEDDVLVERLGVLDVEPIPQWKGEIPDFNNREMIDGFLRKLKEADECRSNNLEDFTSRVVREAKLQSGYDSICINGIRTYYQRNDFEGAVRHAIDETIYWDGEFEEND